MSTIDASETSNKSTQTFLAAFILNAAIGAAEITAFLVLRRFFPKIYSSRSELVPKQYSDLRAEPLPSKSLFSVIPAIIRADELSIIKYNGLDAYLFVRFIKLMLWIFAPIAFVTWAVLLPVYGTGSGGNEQLNRFTFGNIGRDQRPRYAAPLILAWLSTFWILFIIHREWRRYIQLRRDFLTSAGWQALPQSNTVLVTGIPSESLNLEAIHHFADTYPGGVARVWLARDPGHPLKDAYDDRQKASKRLEKAALKVIKTSVKLVKKIKVPAGGKVDAEQNSTSILSRYLPEKKRPTHKLGKLPCIGTKVDTINHSTEEIEIYNNVISEGRAKGEESYQAKSSAFIMFNEQISAHEFAQNLNKNLPLKMRMTGRFINAAPDDVVWSNLNVSPASNKIRKLVSWAITLVTIIFWAIPVAFVSSISNVSNLCSKVSWLAWLCTLPTPINGIIQGALPPIVFAVLFMLLPIFLRKLSQFEGTPLRSLIERSLQKRYFAFLFIHGFIISTLAAGIMSGITQITDNPSSIVSLLANRLPTASVFFLTLVVTNGLAGAAGGILQIGRLIIYYVKAFLLDGSPRALHKVRYTMPSVKFGQLYPAQLLIVVIALAYSTIAPLVCGFALVTFALWWICYKYLFIWVNDQPDYMETGGLFFKTALNQMFAGLYIEHLCLIGLFFLARNESDGFAALPEAICMVVLLILTVLTQIWLNWKTKRDNVYLTRTGLNGSPSTTLNPAAPGKTNFIKTVGQVLIPGKHAHDGQSSSPANGLLSRTMQDGTPMSQAYLNPVFYRDQPTLWLPRDDLGISGEQVMLARSRGVDMTDLDATISPKGKVDIQRDTLPGQPFDP